MAILTKTEKYVAETYAKYFGRAANADTIKEYGLKDNGKAEKLSVILKNIIAAADAEKEGLSTSEFVNNAFQNLFGRNASTKEMNKYSKVIEKGKNLPINSIVKSATKADKAVNKNKLEVAAKYAELGGNDELGLDLSKISKGNLVDLKTVVTLTDLDNAIYNLADNSGIPSSFDGKTFVLTEGVDAGKGFIGTNKDDLFIADNSVKVNASAADTLDGGKGVDTFKVYDDAAGAGTSNIKSLPTLKNIENVVIYDNQNAALDLAKWDTVETLFLVGGIATTGITLGEKVTTVNFEDIAAADQIVTFDKDLTAATIGVNKVGAAAAAVTVTVDSATAALKTLTINASGKASNVILEQDTTNTIETLNITGRADLTLAYTKAITAPVTTSKIVTIDGSKAQGKLNLDLDTQFDAATLKTVKTGTGDDTVTLTGLNVASGTTINLGAGNDKLVADTTTAGSVVTSTTTVIDGGAGIDSLDAALVKVGNAGVFANFEIISLTTATGATALDMDLLTKSTITSIAKDKDAAHELINVKKSQSLTINTTVAASATATVLKFKDSEIAGTADAYTINFNADNAAVNFNAGTVTIDGIETVIVNSVGKTGATNTITLNDKDAKSLVINGDKALDVKFGAAFGTKADATNGLGVSTIDASASTAGINIAGTELTKVEAALSGLTIKGGAGADHIITGDITKVKMATLTIDSGAGNDEIDLSTMTVATTLTKADIKVNAGAGDDIIKVGLVGGTFTLGAGNDKIDVSKAVAAGTTVATGAITTTITDIEKGDVIQGLSGTLFTQANIDGANSLDAALLLAANQLAAGGITTWFQYGSKTYIVDDKNADAFDATAGTGDIVVELNGTVNLGNSTFDATANTLTIG